MNTNLGYHLLRVVVAIIMFSWQSVFAQDVTIAGPATCGGTVSGTWTVPCNVTAISIELYGGGGGAGGGGGGSNGGLCNTRGGGGGGGGGYTATSIQVTPNSTFTYNVGAGGCGGSNGGDASNGNDGNDGGNSTFSGTDATSTAVALTANGGAKGTKGQSCVGGNGNTGTAGAGGTASGGTTNTTGGNGNAGSGATGGTGGAGGAGAGSTSGIGGASTGASGGSYGGGGAGGGDSNGGTGGAGVILITYTATTSLTIPTVTTTAATCSASGNSTVSNYDATVTYIFSPTGPTVGAGGVISGMTTGISYTLAASDGSCTSSPSSSFSNDAQLVTPTAPSAISPVAYCLNDAATSLSATADIGNSLLWYTTASGGTGTATAPIPSTTTAGTNIYYVSQTNGSCESSRTAITVIVTETNITFSVFPAQHCTGDTVVITASGGISYLWSTGSTTDSIITTTIGLYSVNITASNGCTADSSYTLVTSPHLGTVSLPDSSTACEISNPITLYAETNNAETYLWNTDSTTSTSLADADGVYSVTVSNGCETKTKSCVVKYVHCNCFKLPTAFSPNGDGVNDFYNWVNNCDTVIAYTMRIYNRWGEKVFETSSQSIGWDGKYKGMPQPTESYTVFIEITYPIGRNRIRTDNKESSFTLLR